MIITCGDIFSTNIKIIAHQVNCKGSMGSGLAKKVKERYPKIYQEYLIYIGEYIKQNSEPPLGMTLACFAEVGREIWNVFGQDDYGRDKQYTDYEAVKDAFIGEIDFQRECEEISWDIQFPIAIPYNFGCGLAGGDWKIMTKVLEEIEKDMNVVFVAYKLDK